MVTIAEVEREGCARSFPDRNLTGTAWHRFQLVSAVAMFFVLGTLFNLGAWGAACCGVRRSDVSTWQRCVLGLCRLWRWLACGLGVLRVEIFRKEAFDRLAGMVVAANHPSLLDAFVLLGLVPRAVCVMRADLRRHPALGTLAKLAGFLPNDRGPALVRAGREKLRAGMNLVVFPEGTRSEGVKIGQFKPGFALAAMMARAPVLPVGIRYTGEAFRKGRRLLAPAVLPGRMEIIAGEPLHPWPGEEARDFARRVRAECERLAT